MNINIGALKSNSPEHEHSFHEIIICTGGAGFLQTKKEQIPFREGTIIIVPPRVPHCSVSRTDFERIFINGYFDKSLDILTPVALRFNNEIDSVVLAKLIYKNRYDNTEYLSSLLNTFLIYILKAIETDDEVTVAIRSITHAITENFYDCNINLSDILNKSGYSEDYIRAQFKIKTGKTPVKFLTEIRIAHSCILMDVYKKTLSLSKIAEKCGYTDYVYFSKRFKEIKGLSPREYMLLK